MEVQMFPSPSAAIHERDEKTIRATEDPDIQDTIQHFLLIINTVI